jgi:UDP-N-acetylglucosamine 2-epimerase (non-hydrolysing)
MDDLDFYNFLKHFYLILSDSGGIQEEPSALGKPLVVLRNTIDRTQGIEGGRLKLVGKDENFISNVVNQLY